MPYLRGRVIAGIPFLVFDKIAEDDEELQDYLDEHNGGNPDPLVIDEELLINNTDPDYIGYNYGVCLKKIQVTPTIAYVDRDAGEITTAQNDNTAAVNIAPTNELEEKIAQQIFVFDGKNFPMTLGARGLYNSVNITPAGNLTIKATDGDYVLTDINRAGFLEAYGAKMFEFLGTL